MTLIIFLLISFLNSYSSYFPQQNMMSSQQFINSPGQTMYPGGIASPTYPNNPQQPEVPEMWRDTQVDNNLRVSTTRFNWYERRKTTKSSYFMYDQVAALVEGIKHMKTMFLQKNIEAKKIFDAFLIEIRNKSMQINNNAQDVNFFIDLFNQYKQNLNTILEEDLAQRDKNFKKECAQVVFDCEENILRVQNIINTINVVSDIQGKCKLAMRQFDNCIKKAEEYESISWQEYQKLDELISDSQAKEVAKKIKNNKANIEQLDQYIRSRFVSFFNKSLSLLTQGIDEVYNNFDNWNDQFNVFINQYNLIVEKNEKDKKAKEEENKKKIEQEAQLKLQEEKNQIELAKKKKIEEEQRALKMRPWYIKLLDDYLIKSFNFAKKITFETYSYISAIYAYIEPVKTYIQDLFGINKKNEKQHRVINQNTNNISNNENKIFPQIENNNNLIQQTPPTPQVVSRIHPNHSIENIAIKEIVGDFDKPKPQKQQSVQSSVPLHNTSEMAPHLSPQNPLVIAQNAQSQMVPNPFVPGTMIDQNQLQQMMQQQNATMPQVIQTSENLDAAANQYQQAQDQSYYQKYNQQIDQFQQQFSDASQQKIQDNQQQDQGQSELESDFVSSLQSSQPQAQIQQIGQPSFAQIASSRRQKQAGMGGGIYGVNMGMYNNNIYNGGYNTGMY
jgi:hypothetical protein